MIHVLYKYTNRTPPLQTLFSRLEDLCRQLFAYEFKYSGKKGGVKCPLTFSNNYPDVPFSVVTQDNYMDFVTDLV